MLLLAKTRLMLLPRTKSDAAADKNESDAATAKNEKTDTNGSFDADYDLEEGFAGPAADAGGAGENIDSGWEGAATAAGEGAAW